MTMVGIECKLASCLYMQLSKEHRVSRSFRATWFFRNLTDLVEPCTPTSDSSADLSVLSVLGGNQLAPGTDVFYICQEYSLVFVLDMSPTMMAVSNTTYKIKVDEAVSSLIGCLRCLARPFQVPGGSGTLEPHLCVTVLAYCGSAANKPIHVLLQGVDLHYENWEKLTELLRNSIRDYEVALTQECTEKSRPLHYSYVEYHSKGDSSLEGMVKAGTLALQLLPRNALKGLILLTDGICGFPSSGALHTSVNLMRGHNISCWVVHVGGPPDPTAAFGLLPDIETLGFMTEACNGCLMKPEKIQQAVKGLSDDSLPVNAVQRAVLFWTFQKGAHSARVKEVKCDQCTEQEDQFAPIVYRNFQRYTINAPLLCVIGCRIREGFLLKDVLIKDTTLEMVLYYPWQPSVTIYYTIMALWPVTDESTTLQVTTSYDGPYSFVHDIHCDLNLPITSPFRVTAARKFKQVLKTFSNSDTLLAHFLSFSATPTYYTLPQTLQDGMPLFYLQPNQSKPVPSVGLSTSGDKRPRESPLITFWRPLCTIDTSLWYRWFHSDKIILVLQQDSFLPRNLLAPSSNGRFASIQCRLAALKLFAFLKSWSTFILLENHSFIRFLPSKESPKYFCFVRVAQKPPCVVLHVGHIEGTPHTLQSKTLHSLHCALQELGGSERAPGHGHKRRSRAAQPAKNCATVIDKQLQRVMIRYDNLAGLATQSLSLVAGGEGERQTQMDYLTCTRWQWRVPRCGPAIPSALLRHRLKEGFHMTSAHNGVVTLAAQLTMQQSHSRTPLQMLLQYVVFPADDQLNCVTTELWVEPQHGYILGTPPTLHYLEGLQHTQISDKLQVEDEKLVTAVSSFLFLHRCCQRRVPQLALDEGEEERERADMEVRPDIKSCHTPFQLSSLLSKCRVLGFTVTTFSEVNAAAVLDLSSSSPLNKNFREEFLQQLRNVAPTEVPVLDSSPLLHRLLASEALTTLCSVCYLREDSAELGWRCFAQCQDDNLYMFFVPAYFSLPSDTGDGDQDADSPQPFVLPVLLLQCSQQVLLDPDPAQLVPPTLQSDVYEHLSLSQPLGSGSHLEDNLSQLVSKLRVMYYSSYLQTIHSTLLSGSQLTPQDFLTALTVCKQTTLSVDLTPLIAALCPHASVHLPQNTAKESAPLSTETLCHLLETLASHRKSSCLVSPNLEMETCSSTPHCVKWKSEVDQAFVGYLTALGFARVPECGGYYWFNTAIAPHMGSHEQKHSDSGSSSELFPKLLHLSDSDHEDGDPAPPSPGSEPSTLLKMSISEDYEETTDLSTEIPDHTSLTPSSGGDMEPISPLLSNLFDPRKLGGSGYHKETVSQMVAPLFLHIVCTVTNHETQKSESADVILPTPGLPVCLRSVSSPASSYSVSLDLLFLSFIHDPQHSLDKQDTIKQESVFPLGGQAPPTLPTVYLSTTHELMRKVEWLISDELISVSREASLITPTLLQAVATHVQTSGADHNNCFSHRVPLKFVFGTTHSMTHFVLQLESINVPEMSVVKKQDYFYLSPTPHPSSSSHSSIHTFDFEQQLENLAETKCHASASLIHTPSLEEQTFPVNMGRRASVSQGSPLTSPPLLSPSKSKSHRRSVSLGYVPIPSHLESSHSVFSVEGTGYEASQSSSLSSLSGHFILDGSPEEEGTQFWLVIRVLGHEVEVYFQIRSSWQEVGTQLNQFHKLCDSVVKEVHQVCHRTNQWFLLKDMLETRMCSPLLLPESAPEAWVDEIVSKQVREGSQGGEVFRPMEFECQQQWKKHITPNWRLKAMRPQAALRITRTALSAFAVSNRTDVYVLQDVRENGEETIFYLKIDESLCRVDVEGGELVEEGQEHCETRAPTEVESVSSFSYSIYQSVSEIPELDRRATTSSLELPSSQSGWPQESLVLQLYGIAKPSLSFLTRLSHIVNMKLDDATLEVMCALYARNQKLSLYPVDVQFLQPSQSEVSHVMNIPIPPWISMVDAFLFYLLQTLSAMALRPRYTSTDTRDHFCVARPLHNAYLNSGLPQELHQDHLFLYIRPHTQGRGMAVICVSMVSPRGQSIVPQPGMVSPDTNCCPPDLECEEATMQCQIQEVSETRPPTGSHFLYLHIWEKGNVGMADLSIKLSSCFKHAMIDYLLEVCLLPLPIARPEDSSVWSSPASSPSAFPGNDRRGSSRKTSIEQRKGGSQKTSTEEKRGSSRRASTEKKESASPRTSTEIKATGSRGSVEMKSPVRKVSTSSFKSVETLPLRSDSRRASVEGESSSGKSSSEKSPKRKTSDTSLRSIEGSKDISDAMHLNNGGSQLPAGPEGSQTWYGREKLRREHEVRDAYFREAHLGQTGILEETYHTTIPKYLAYACKLASPSISQFTYSFLGSYSAQAFATKTIMCIQQICPDLTLNAFKLKSEAPLNQYAHCTLDKDWIKMERTDEPSQLHYIVVGRNPQQWEECCNPAHHSTQSWIDQHIKRSLQLFYPLNSRKSVRGAEVPLQQSAVGGEAFVPRQRLILMSITSQQAQLWFYNLSEEMIARVRHQLNMLGEWQQMRAGLLHHILAQKMGLFQHTHARDIQNCTKMASKHCSTLQEVNKLVKNTSPIADEPTPTHSPRRPHVMATIAIETFYQETPPHTPTPHSADPVFNHGQQFRDSHTYQRKQYDNQELLGKVFTSWQSRKREAGAPVNSATIDNLKRRARLLHYCTSPLLLQRSLSPLAESDKLAPWLDPIREEVLARYIEYLHSLGFQTINERPPIISARHKDGSRTPSRPVLFSSSQRLYKCLQRSWPGGIILTEVLFQEDMFHVKLYTLESSRLINQPTLSPEVIQVHGLFSMECAHYKDFIHVHSFMHDFHLRFLLSLLNGTRQSPEQLDIRQLLQLFWRQNKVPPSFIQNRLCKDNIHVPVSVNPSDLYHYIVAHCGVFGTETFEMRGGTSRPLSPSNEDICLLIDVSPRSLGPTTTPELSRLLENFEESYFIRVLMMYKPEDHSRHLNLSFFLLLVNKFDSFPRLTCDSSQLGTTHHPFPHTIPLDPPQQGRDESDLNFNVRKHRRKLGLGSLTSPSGPLQVMLNTAMIEEQLQGLRDHLRGIVKAAQSHMRRDELWKRMVYGPPKTDAKPSSVQLEPLSCVEFEELLHLVTVCQLDSLDPRLAPLRRQTRKWYRKLMGPLVNRFADTIRLYSSDDDCYKFAAIVNPEWQDMFVLVQSDRDGRHQGFSAVYRKPREGGVPLEERPITAHIEADRAHIETVVNFAASSLWASILDTSPPQPHLNLL